MAPYCQTPAYCAKVVPRKLKLVITLHTSRTLCVEYSAPVSDCRRELRLLPPVIRGGQSLQSSDWQCHPLPDSSQEKLDDFGNRLLFLHHRRLAGPLRFEVILTTSHAPDTPVSQVTNLPSSGLGAFLLPSALCNLTPQIQHDAIELQGASPLEVCNFVYRRLEYAPGTTGLNTSASQSLQSGSGVCQDFAHAMIALCRALKMPARYVSGYLPGEGALHAWCEVLINGAWHGYDPTHNRVIRDDYVFVACGRDFRDCATHTGTFRGKAQARLSSYGKTVLIDSHS